MPGADHRRAWPRVPGAVRVRRPRPGPPDDEDDEVRRLEDDLLDLEPLLRDAVVLELPFQPLCEDDCPGLCVECGARLADDPDHAHEAADRPALGQPGGAPARRPDQTDRNPTERRTVAVPKRKMSRSNTRHRRSQWKAVAPTLVTCANPACGAKHLPHRACGECGQYGARARPPPGPLTRPGPLTDYARARERRSAIPSWIPSCSTAPSPTARTPTRTVASRPTSAWSSSATRCSASWSPRRSTATHPDLSEGRLAKLRAAVVNARALAEVASRDRPRRAHQARPRRGDDRRPQQGLDPVRHRRGGDRGDPPQRRASRRPPAVVHLLFDPLMEAAAAMGAGPGLEDLPAGALRRARSRRPRVRHRGRRAPTT